jgi:hypothetical protein
MGTFSNMNGKDKIILIVGLICGLLFLKACFGGDTNNHDDPKSSAYIMGQKFINKFLVSPSSADYPVYMNDGSGDVQIIQNDKAYTIKSFVEANNKLGVKLRMPYIIELESDDGHNWTCKSLLLDGIQYR